MKKTTKIFGLLLTLFGLALVTGCTPITDTPEVPEETTYTVTFNTDGGSTVESQTIKSGEKATKPADPTKTATNDTTFTFDNWYTSTDNGKTFSESAFDFDTEIKADITLYAKWNTTVLYSITIESTNGTVTASKTSKITAGETITLTVTPNDGYELGTLSVKNGDIDNTVTQDSSDVTKYTFTMPAGKVTVSATFKVIPPTTANYTVKHFKQNLDDDNYTEVTTDAQTLNGTIGAQTTAVAKTYTGFTAPETITQTEIKADGTTVIEIRYTRNTYTVSFVDGTNEELTLPQNASYKYGKTISVDPDVLNSTVAYIVWTDGTNEYNTDGNNNPFEITVTGNVTLAAKELWFNGNCPVMFFYNPVWSSSSRKNLSEWNIRIPASEITIKNYFKLYEFEPEEDGEDTFYGVNSSRPGGREITVSSLKYEDGILKVYF